MTNKIVKNASSGYGYKYASLADIAAQGYEIPKMKVVNFENVDYVYFYDKELKDWQQGSRIVVPESKGMNQAQLYGSALTYARRYTTLLALGLACDDDVAIENLKADGSDKTKEPKPIEKATQDQIDIITGYYSPERLEKIYKHYKVKKLAELNIIQASEVIKVMEKEQKNG